MRWLVWVLVVVASSARAAGNDPLAEAWRATDLDFALSKNFINNERCNSNPEYYSSCVAAVHAANKLLHDPLNLIDGESLNFDQTLHNMAARLPAEIPLQMMLGAAINAHLRSFDAHAFLRPTALDTGALFHTGYAGIGVVIRKVDTGFLITEVAEKSPAEGSGLKPGDIITAVSGVANEDLQRDSVNDLVIAAAGEPGSAITVTVARGILNYTVTLLREPVNISNVEFKTLPGEPAIAMIRIHHFYAGITCQDVQIAMQKFDAKNFKQLILDLRGNGGGATLDALCVGGIFVGAQQQVGTQYIGVKIPEEQMINVFDKSPRINLMTGYNLIPRPLPLVVLVDGLSASAAEIVAGAVQSNKAGWLVGQRTYGKGSVQTTSQLFMHNSLTIGATTGRFFFPNSMSNQRVGITPSFEVPWSREIQEPPVKRESEVFPASLPAINAAWPDPRGDEIAKIRACIKRQNLDQTLLKELVADYQKAYGVAVLKCSDSAK
jgi:carboxyl-terminal processing protease